MTTGSTDLTPELTATPETPAPTPARRLSAFPLRVQLVAISVILVTVGLSVAGAAAVTSLRDYLYSRVDAQLGAALGQQLQRPRDFGIDGHGGPPSQYYVTYADGTGNVVHVDDRRLATDDNAIPKLPKLTVADATAKTGRPFTVPSTAGNSKWRVIESPANFNLYNGTTITPVAGSIAIATRLDDVNHTVGRLERLELIIGLIVVAFIAIVSYLVVRRALRPLTEVERTAEKIAEGDMTQRVPEADPRTEVGRLARALNTMLGQIESAFRRSEASEAEAKTSEERMRRFVADASHELRTPLTSIRGFAELHRQGAVSDAAGVSRAMNRIEGEATRMGVLVDDLLLLARLDQQRPLEQLPVDLATLTTETVQSAQMSAPDRAISVTIEGDNPPVVTGDELRLRQVLANLLTNALTHTPSGVPVEVDLRVNGQSAVIEVVDHGPGMASDEAHRAFERFYRADPSRARAQGGTGLGLSIVRGIVDAHSGRVELETEPGEGATFRVILPLRPREP